MIIYLFAGLTFLIIGAELLVRGASRIAKLAGISPLIIGLTIVAFGTSAPELAVSIKASLSSQSDIAVGNVVGSNIFNILFILGIAALIRPLKASKQLVRFDVPIMIAVSALAWILMLNSHLNRIEGLLLFAGIFIYLFFIYRNNQKNNKSEIKEHRPPVGKSTTNRKNLFILNFIFIIIGLLFLVIGAKWFVTGASDLARALGVSELIIGLTVVAAGTSLPEAATSIVASIRKEREIAIGNVIGSNIFNILVVLGLSAAISGDVSISTGGMNFNFLVMLLASLACLPVFFTGGEISRFEGGSFLIYYLFYGTFLVLAATKVRYLRNIEQVIKWLILPSTIILIIFSIYSYFRKTTQTKK